MRKKVVEFDLSQLLPIGLTLVVLGIGVAYGLEVTGDVRDDMCPSGYAYNTSADLCCITGSDCATGTTNTSNPAEFNATQDAIDGVAKLPEKLPLIATVIVAVIIIGILMRYLMVRL